MITAFNSPGGYGFDVKNEDHPCYVRGSAVNKGDLCCLQIRSADDNITADSLTPTLSAGSKGSIFANMVKVYTGDAPGCQIFGVALENIPDQGQGMFRFRGIVNQAYGIRSDANAAGTGAGAAGVPGRSTASTMIEWQHGYVTPLSVGDAHTKVVAIALETKTGAASSVTSLWKVLFDGINGFGGLVQ